MLLHHKPHAHGNERYKTLFFSSLTGSCFFVAVFPSSLFVTPPIPPISPKTFLCCLFFAFSLFSRSLSHNVFHIHTNSFSFIPSPSLSLDKSLARTLWFHYPFLVLEYERSCDNHRCHVMTWFTKPHKLGFLCFLKPLHMSNPSFLLLLCVGVRGRKR